MKIAGLFLLLFLSFGMVYSQSAGDVVFNEIMYAPTAGNSKEWFEIYNKSSNAVNLNGWKWKDATGTLRTITTQSITLNPNSFALICEDSAAVKTFYPSVTGIILQSSGWNAINNTGDDIVIQTSAGLTIDSITFTSGWGGSSGNKSLERISTLNPTNQQANWGTCVAVIGSTPLARNSLSPKDNDLSLNSFAFNRTNPAVGDTLGLIAIVKNRGAIAANTFSVSFYEDYNRDSIPAPNELILTANNPFPLNPNDSVSFTASDILDSSGVRMYISKITFAPDEDTANNLRTAEITVTGGGSSSGNVIVNEIMYDPPTGENEWVELFNSGDSVVNLKNWKIQDNTVSQVVITGSDYFLQPDSFVVISKTNVIFTYHPGLPSGRVIINASLPALNNDGDAVIIIKTNGSNSDRVDYLPSWGGDGVSLERLEPNGISNDSANWAGSIDCEKSTPGKVNSLTSAERYVRGDLIVNEIMAAPQTGEAEYIELYNPTNKTINLSSWLMTETGGSHTMTDTCTAIIKPGMYVVIASDDTIYTRFPYLRDADSTRKVFIAGSLGLNNEEELVNITDLFRTTIDSVYYFDNWYNPNLPGDGRSLEKINPSLNGNDAKSWSSSTDGTGGTPGKKNSIFTSVQNTTGSLSVAPNPFSPDGDGFEDFCVISYRLNSPVSQVRLKIFDVKGRLVRTILNNAALGSNGTVVFNGLDDDKRKLRLGIYVVFLESLNDQNGVVETLKTVVVVAAKL